MPTSKAASATIRTASRPRTQELDGYAVTEIEPWEAASGSRAVQLPGDDVNGSVRFRFDGPPGPYDLHVRYFDEEDGVSKFKLFVAEQLLDEWQADNHVPTPTTLPDAHSSIRRTVRGVALRPGDEIRIEGTADGERTCRHRLCRNHAERREYRRPSESTHRVASPQLRHCFSY